MNVNLINLKNKLKQQGLIREAEKISELIKLSQGTNDDSFSSILNQKIKDIDDEEEEVVYTHEEENGSFDGGGVAASIAEIMIELEAEGPDDKAVVSLKKYIEYLERKNNGAKFNIPKDNISGTVVLNIREAVEKVKAESDRFFDSQLDWMNPEYDPRIDDFDK